MACRQPGTTHNRKSRRLVLDQLGYLTRDVGQLHNLAILGEVFTGLGVVEQDSRRDEPVPGELLFQVVKHRGIAICDDHSLVKSAPDNGMQIFKPPVSSAVWPNGMLSLASLSR
jgi:hypothetical protein